jgi:hypothetical protein
MRFVGRRLYWRKLIGDGRSGVSDATTSLSSGSTRSSGYILMSCMDRDIRERVEALRREIAELQRLNLEYSQRARTGFVAMHDQERREQRLKEIMHELKSMTARENALGAEACHVWQPCNPKSSGKGPPSA